MENNIIKINHFFHGETTVKVVRETAKAILLAGGASEAWFPKAAIDGDNTVADWFPLTLEHFFLFDVPLKAGVDSNPA